MRDKNQTIIVSVVCEAAAQSAPTVREARVFFERFPRGFLFETTADTHIHSSAFELWCCSSLAISAYGADLDFTARLVSFESYRFCITQEHLSTSKNSLCAVQSPNAVHSPNRNVASGSRASIITQRGCQRSIRSLVLPLVL